MWKIPITMYIFCKIVGSRAWNCTKNKHLDVFFKDLTYQGYFFKDTYQIPSVAPSPANLETSAGNNSWKIAILKNS